ncbi:MAG: hypothetical protein V4534_07915 [Myxococcota bacterium]
MNIKNSLNLFFLLICLSRLSYAFDVIELLKAELAPMTDVEKVKVSACFSEDWSSARTSACVSSGSIVYFWDPLNRSFEASSLREVVIEQLVEGQERISSEEESALVELLTDLRKEIIKTKKGSVNYSLAIVKIRAIGGYIYLTFGSKTMLRICEKVPGLIQFMELMTGGAKAKAAYHKSIEFLWAGIGKWQG